MRPRAGNCFEAAPDLETRGASEQRTDVTELRDRAGEIVERQERGIDHLRALFVAVADSRRALIAIRERHEELASEAAAVAEQRERAAELLAEAGRDHTRAAHVRLEASPATEASQMPQQVLAGF